MSRGKLLRRLCVLVPAGGLLLVNGCLAAIERNMDIVLSPGALGNALVAPYSPVSGLLDFLMRLARG